MVSRHGIAALAVLATLGGTEAGADEGQCTVDSASLNYGLVPSLRSGWHPGVGEVVIRCRNVNPTARTFNLAVALAHEDPLENTSDPHAPRMKLRFFEDPGHRLRWGGGGRRQEGKAVGLTVDGVSEGIVRVPVYGMVFCREASLPVSIRAASKLKSCTATEDAVWKVRR